LKVCRELLPFIRRRFADLIDPRLHGSVLQPLPQFLDRSRPPLRQDFDGAVR
jgi:hypothetical protein